MKPRTRLQVEVMQLSRNLFELRPWHREWAYSECLEHKGFATKSRVICMDCGESFGAELVKRKRAVCPHCETKLRIEHTRKRTDKQEVYFGTAEICGEFQVVRFYELTSIHKAGKAAYRKCFEILQHWILPDGRREVVSRNHRLNWYGDSWCGDLEIRWRNDTFRHSRDLKYDVYPCKYYPESNFKEQYRKYGIDHRLQGLTFLEAIWSVPKEPKAETLLKAKQYGLLGLFRSGSRKRSVELYWPSIKICMRNRYIVKEAGMWIDYLELLEYFRKDLRNAHYVCPKNLKRAHDRLVAKKRRIEERIENERKRRQALENEAQYRRFITRFLDLKFSDDEIEILPLKTVEEFMHEGDALKHCVFTNQYFKRENCLILSARRNGERLETIEFNLEMMRVEQSRGKFNSETEYHERIVRMVNRNKRKIKSCMKIEPAADRTLLIDASRDRACG